MAISENRWKCKRCRKKYGLFTNSVLNRTNFSLKEIYELLHWFEMELSDHRIAEHLKADYHRVHRFFMRAREAMKLLKTQ